MSLEHMVSEAFAGPARQLRAFKKKEFSAVAWAGRRPACCRTGFASQPPPLPHTHTHTRLCLPSFPPPTHARTQNHTRTHTLTRHAIVGGHAAAADGHHRGLGRRRLQLRTCALSCRQAERGRVFGGGVWGGGAGMTPPTHPPFVPHSVSDTVAGPPSPPTVGAPQRDHHRLQAAVHQRDVTPAQLCLVALAFDAGRGRGGAKLSSASLSRSTLRAMSAAAWRLRECDTRQQ